MTPRTPDPGSPWHRLCPTAWPREWLDPSGELPPGFTRAADPLEADLITGRASEAAFLAATGRAPAGPEPVPTADRRKPSPVVEKVLGYRQFFDALPDLDPRLSPGAVALWCWLWTCTAKGQARCSVRALARRFGAGHSTIVKRLRELRAAGLIWEVQRGRTGKTCTVLLVRPTSRRGRAHPADRTGGDRSQDGNGSVPISGP